MSLVLRGLTCCLAYVDDSICFSKSFEDHIVDLEMVLDRFRQAKLKLKPTKCKFFQSRVRFVGHYVSSKGIEVDDDKIGCILNWPFPRTITELRGFLGLCGYYRSFCPGFAGIADPLTECLRKGVALCWTPERQAAFDKLKSMLTSAPVLAMPRDDADCKYVLDSDASGTACSAILQQWQDGKLRVIEFASRTFSAAERAYCATRREMTALIFGLKLFRQYLLGRSFEVRVDNMALTFYQRMKDPTGQAARYLEILSDYTFDIKHRSGSQHGNADSVSRIRPCEIEGGEPCRQCHRRMTGKHSVNMVQTRTQRAKAADNSAATAAANQPPASADAWGGSATGNSQRKRKRKSPRAAALDVTAPTAWEASTEWNPLFIREKQMADPDIAPALMWAEAGSRPAWEAVQGSSPMLRSLWQQFDSLVVREGVLYRSFYNPAGLVILLQLILPAAMKVAFLEFIHADAAGHLKFAKCLSHIMKRAWWYSWKRDLKLFIRCCSKCEAFHRGSPPRQANLHPMLVGAPGERFSIDLTGPHPPSNGFRYMFTAICCFSKFGICVPIRNKEASTVAKAIVDHIFLKWGLCHELLTDQGPEFEAELFKELLDVFGVQRLRTSGYRSQTNGSCKVWHRTLNSMFAKVINENQRNWAECAPHITLCYNATEHSSTGFSPFFLFTGRQPLLHVDLALPEVNAEKFSAPQYAALVSERLDKAAVLVREHLKMAAENASKWYNRKARPKEFQEGDQVRVYCPRRYVGRSPKWQSFYRTEGTILRKLNDATYLVKSKSWREPKVVHTDKIKPILAFT